MSHPLDGIRVKIQRTQEHIRNLYLDVDRVFNSDPRPYTLIQNLNSQSGRYELTIRQYRAVDVDLLRFSVVAGEIIHHLRSSLDHLVWQLIIANGQDPSSFTYPLPEFPIFSRQDKYESSGVAKIKGVSKSAMAIIQSHQPYNGGDYRGNYLWIIHEMNNADKHRLLNVVFTDAIIERAVIAGATLSNFTFGPAKDGTVLVSSPTEFEMDMNVRFRFDIAFNESGMSMPESAVPELQYLTDAVIAVIDTLAPCL